MLTYDLDRSLPTSLYEQLYGAIRRDVDQGFLASGDRLPSKRALARHLGVSVITVEAAYDQLVAEGYVRAVPRSGFFVEPWESLGGASGPATCNAPGRLPSGAAPGRLKAGSASGGPEGGDGSGRPATCNAPGRRSARTPCGAGLDAPWPQPESGPAPWADFTGATAPEGLFPYAAWARTLRAVLNRESESSVLAAGEASGSRQLREAIARHLRTSRGMNVDPRQIVIGSGAQSLYGLIVQLLGRHLVYGVEDPGYPRLASIYRSNDVNLAFVPLDGAGPDPRALTSLGVEVLHCMPSHQFPLGVTTPIGRRRELLRWVAGEGEDKGKREGEGKVKGEGKGGDRPKGGDQPCRYIVEDDFDCEFRMAGRPIPSLQSLDRTDRVIYANTFTKTLGAAFRIGYMVLPPKLAQAFHEKLGFYTCSVGALEQLTLARFMASGEYERHVNRQRVHFRRVQGQLIEALGRTRAGGRLRFESVGSGLHFLMRVEGSRKADAMAIVGSRKAKAEDEEAKKAEAREREEAISARAAQGGVRLAPVASYGFGFAPLPDDPVFVMSFASLRTEVIDEAARVISDSVEESFG